MWKIKRLFAKDKPCVIDRSELQNEAIKALEKKHDFLAVIGTGAYSDIMAFWSREKNCTVAAKVMHPQVTSEGEVKLWPRLKHHNIVRVLKMKRREDVDIFLMPHYTDTLLSILEEESFRANSHSFLLATDWITDILSGLDYLHKSDICHLDLKADNIMITAQKTAAIGDFGSIEYVTSLTDGYALPRYYCPPEAWPLEIHGPLPKVNGKAFDVWSVGMIIFYCFSDRWMEQHLWGRTNWWDEIFPLVSMYFQHNLCRRQLMDAFPCSEISEVICAYSFNLVKGVLRYKPEDRPTTSEILRHILLNSRGNDLLEPDIIWTDRKEEVQKHILECRLKHMIKTAALLVQKEKERSSDTTNKELGIFCPGIPKEEHLNGQDALPSRSSNECFRCCCLPCCRKQGDT